MKHFLLTILLFSIATLPLLGEVKKELPSRVPAYPNIIEKVQPDGDTLHIRLVGDERKHRVTTEDGYKIAQNKKGFYCYVRGERTTCRKAHDQAKRSKSEQRWLSRV